METGRSRPFLAVNHLSIGIPGNGQRVAGLNFSLDRGQILGIAGESGSGKTLTACALAGLLPNGVTVMGGSVTFDGRSLYTAGKAGDRALGGRDILFLFQSPLSALDPRVKTGVQIVDTLRHGLGCSRDQARLKAFKAMARTGLSKSCFNRFPFELSGGQRQRVLMAMAAGLGPKLLIADEPTAGQDEDNRDRLIQLTAGLVRETGNAAIWVSHDLRVLSNIADTLVILFRGRQVEAGPTDRLLSAPAHPHTRALVAAMAYLEA